MLKKNVLIKNIDSGPYCSSIKIIFSHPMDKVIH